MSLPYPNPKWTDGGFAIATACSLPVFSSPIPAVSTEYVLKQDFMQARNNFAALAFNTTHPDYPTFYLVEEGEKLDQGGAVIRWTRTYAKVPVTHYEYQSANYSFIGMTTDAGGGAFQTRARQNKKVTSRMQFDYFLVPSTGITDPITGDIYNVTSPGDIETILEMQYVGQGTIGGAIYGGITAAVDALQLSASSVKTYPSTEQYQAQMSDALQHGWSATKAKMKAFTTSTLAGGPPPTSGHAAGVIDTANSIPDGTTTVQGGMLPAENSQLVRWMGNIYQRATRYVLAQ